MHTTHDVSMYMCMWEDDCNKIEKSVLTFVQDIMGVPTLVWAFSMNAKIEECFNHYKQSLIN